MSRPRVESVWSDEVVNQRGLPGCVACRGRVLRVFGVMKWWTSGAARLCGMSRPCVESVWSDEVVNCQAVGCGGGPAGLPGCGMSRPRVESVWSDEVLDQRGCQAVWHVAAAC